MGCVLAKLDDQIILAVVLASESNDVWCKGIQPLFPKKGLTKYFSVIFFRPDFNSVDLILNSEFFRVGEGGMC